MKKTPTLFMRYEPNMNVLSTDINPEASWVFDGEGVATRKYDGTCVLLSEDGTWWARREVKPGKTAPENFYYLGKDETTGKVMGYVPMDPHGYFHPLMDALEIAETAKELEQDDWAELIFQASVSMQPGTYELCGPKINGNPEGYLEHVLIRHGDAQPLEKHHPLTFSVLNKAMAEEDPQVRFDAVKATMMVVGTYGWEGLVWHHEDGRYAKIKVRDFR